MVTNNCLFYGSLPLIVFLWITTFNCFLWITTFNCFFLWITTFNCFFYDSLVLSCLFGLRFVIIVSLISIVCLTDIVLSIRNVFLYRSPIFYFICCLSKLCVFVLLPLL